MKILVTGGTGFIGSHTVVELINAGCEPIIVDNLSNSNIGVLDGIEKICGVRPKFYEIDCRDKDALDKLMQENEEIDFSELNQLIEENKKTGLTDEIGEESVHISK